MDSYNVKRICFTDGIVDTRIYKRSIQSRKLSEEEKLERYETLIEPHEISEEKKEEYAKRSCIRAKQNIYEIARNGSWDWFITLTLNPDQVNRYNYSECSKKVSKWLNHLRRKCPDLRYIIVPEQHKDGAYHFYGLFSNIENLEIVDSNHKDYKTGDIIYNLESYKFGWSTMTRVKDNAAVVRYLTKYITKDLIASIRGKKKYWASRNIERPKVEIEELWSEDKCFLWQELLDGAIYANMSSGSYNEVMYFQNQVEE